MDERKSVRMKGKRLERERRRKKRERPERSHVIGKGVNEIVIE